jgi:catalase (peroxidase I)
LDSDGVRLFFGRLGFPEEEIVALMGAHTLGRFTSLLGDMIKRPTRGVKETY